LSVTIDTAKPTVTTAVFNYLTAQQLVYTFSEAMAPLTLTSFNVTITDTDTSTDLDNGNFAAAKSGGNTIATFTFPGYANSILPDGNYQSVVTGQQDVAGNAMAVDPSAPYSFFVLAGDADRSKTVDTIDFNLLAANFSQSGQNFSQGDFSYDGTVDTIDFNLLAANFSKALAAPAAAAAPSGSLFSQSLVNSTLASQVL